MSRILVGVSTETTWDVLESQLRSIGFDRVQKPTPELPDVGAVLVAPGKVDKALAQLGRTDGVAFAEVERMRFSQ